MPYLISYLIPVLTPYLISYLAPVLTPYLIPYLTPYLQALPEYFHAASSSPNWAARQDGLSKITDMVLAYPEVLRDAGKVRARIV